MNRGKLCPSPCTQYVTPHPPHMPYLAIPPSFKGEFKFSSHPSNSYSLVKAQFKYHLLLEAALDSPTRKDAFLPPVLKALCLEGTHFREDRALPCSPGVWVLCASSRHLRPNPEFPGTVPSFPRCPMSAQMARLPRSLPESPDGGGSSFPSLLWHPIFFSLPRVTVCIPFIH